MYSFSIHDIALLTVHPKYPPLPPKMTGRKKNGDLSSKSSGPCLQGQHPRQWNFLSQ